MIHLNHPMIDDCDKQAVVDALSSGVLCQGDRTDDLERAFAAICQTKYAIAVSSGTSALFLALKAYGIGPGDEVITTPLSFIATASSIVMTGAKPVFVDIDPRTFNIDPHRVEEAITGRTRAILPVHLYGLPVDMDALIDICQRNNLVLIADAAQATGSTYNNRPVGSYCTSCFSLYATKLITGAELGVIVTNDDSIDYQCRSLRNHGFSSNGGSQYNSIQMGYNLRTSELHAALALSQLVNLDRWVALRKANACKLAGGIMTVITPKDERNHSSWHQYTIHTSRRDALKKLLEDRGIESKVYYSILLYKLKWIRDIVGDMRLENAERAVNEILSIPVHQGLSDNDIEYIIESVNEL